MNLFAWMLARDMETVVAAKGLHPGFGFFHVVGNNRSSLVYDLMEPFRAPVCEALTVNCLNRGWINSSDFPQWDGDATTFTPRLTREGIQKAIRAYERWVAPGRLKYNGKAGYGWQNFFSATVDSYIGHISTGSTFSPYQVDM